MKSKEQSCQPISNHPCCSTANAPAPALSRRTLQKCSFLNGFATLTMHRPVKGIKPYGEAFCGLSASTLENVTVSSAWNAYKLYKRSGFGAVSVTSG